MGNNQSNTNGPQNSNELKPKSISQILDYVATHYIVTMDFQSLKKLYKAEYCDQLVVLTADIIDRYFTDLEVTYLAQRTKGGVEVNILDKDKVVFFDKDRLGTLDIQNSIKKKNICRSIAKFYVKIAHLFAAIVTTINPIYVYKDETGNTVRATLFEKTKIPANTPREILKLNICENRINTLRHGDGLEPNAAGDIFISPNMCTANMGDNGQLKSLEDEPGIPELMDLYMDKYDFEKGEFTGMTDETRKVYLDDLRIFYNTFTGKTSGPTESIRKFSDIKLRDFYNTGDCQGDNPKYETRVKGPITNSYFAKYASHLRQMIISANNNQQSLLSIIDKLFVYTVDPQTNKKQIRVSPTLTEEGLQELIIKARGLIIKLYLTCEVDYVKGLKLYEVIVEQKIFETSKKQKINLKQKEEEFQAEMNAPVPVPAEVAEIQSQEKEKIMADELKIQELSKKVEEEKMESANPLSVNPNMEQQMPPNMEPNEKQTAPNMEQTAPNMETNAEQMSTDTQQQLPQENMKGLNVESTPPKMDKLQPM